MNQKPKRVVIIGASGSGKTTLAHLLSNKWGLPVCDLDELAWLPGWKERDRCEERGDVEEVVAKEKWIIVGNYSRHRDLTWTSADLIIWLDPSLLTCFWRGLRRAIRNICNHTPICNGNYDSWGRLFRLDNRSILYWIATTHKKKRARYQKLLLHDKDPTLPPHVHICKSSDLDAFLKA